jgi:hypothetical protein
MIFNQFDPTDIVAGRTSRVASGFWPNGETYWSASLFTDNFFELTQSAATPSPSYGASIYDIRRTMYYLDVFPDATTHANNDPYFSIAYGNYYGELGSGSFNLDTASIKAFAAKAVYTQYQNMLIGSTDLSGKFQFKSGSATNPQGLPADDIFVMNVSSYKMKDKIDEGLFEITLTGSVGSLTLRDDSPFLSQASSVYNLIPGSINDATTTLPPYQGIGLLYPNDGVVVFNAQVIDQLVGLSNLSQSVGPVAPAGAGTTCIAGYTTQSIQGIAIAGQSALIPSTVNHKVFFWSIQNANNTLKIRKSEYVPARHYFVRVKNRDFNYSNNPTYVYDGTDGIHARGTIYNQDFITNPTTYITTVGLYNDNNELVAVAKLSRPAVKTFDSELLIKVRLDF